MAATQAYKVKYTGQEIYNLVLQDSLEHFESSNILPEIKVKVDDLENESVFIKKQAPGNTQFIIVFEGTLKVVAFGITTELILRRTYGYEAALWLIKKTILEKNNIDSKAPNLQAKESHVGFITGRASQNLLLTMISFDFSVEHESGDDHK